MELETQSSSTMSGGTVPTKNGTSPSSRITFENILGQGRVNQLGGLFINGRPLPDEKRIQIVEMARQGVKPCKISRELKVSHGAVSKILNRFHETGSISPGQIGGNPRCRLSIQAVRQHILRLREDNPTLNASQIKEALVKRGICSRDNVPNTSRINKLLKQQKQKIQVVAKQQKFGRNNNGIAVGGGKPLRYSIENILKNGVGGGGQQEIGPQNAVSSASAPSPPFSASSSPASSTALFEVARQQQQQIACGSDEENQQLQNNHHNASNGAMSSSSPDGRRARTSFSQQQLRLLERTFAREAYPNQDLKEWLITETQLDEEKIITWFSNRRARLRRAIQQPHQFSLTAAPNSGISLPQPQYPATVASTSSANSPFLNNFQVTLPPSALFPFSPAFFPAALLSPINFGFLAAAAANKAKTSSGH